MKQHFDAEAKKSKDEYEALIHKMEDFQGHHDKYA